MSTMYPRGRRRFFLKQLDWANDDFRVVLLSNAYTYDTTHEFLSDVASGARLGTSGAMSSKQVSVADGSVTGVVPTINSVNPSTIVAVLIYQHTGVESTSPLIAFYDGGNLPQILSIASNVNVTWVGTIL